MVGDVQARKEREILNKTELIEKIAEQTGMPKAKAQEHFEAFVGTLTETLKGGDEVRMPGFGKFYVQERAARQGQNPQTGKKMQIAASRVPSFKAGSSFKEAV